MSRQYGYKVKPYNIKDIEDIKRLLLDAKQHLLSTRLSEVVVTANM